MTTPDSPEDLIRKWEAAQPPLMANGSDPVQPWDSRHEDHERMLEREERLDTACTWTLGLFAVLGLWKAVSILVIVICWLFGIG